VITILDVALPRLGPTSLLLVPLAIHLRRALDSSIRLPTLRPPPPLLPPQPPPLLLRPPLPLLLPQPPPRPLLLLPPQRYSGPVLRVFMITPRGRPPLQVRMPLDSAMPGFFPPLNSQGSVVRMAFGLHKSTTIALVCLFFLPLLLLCVPFSENSILDPK